MLGRHPHLESANGKDILWGGSSIKAVLHCTFCCPRYELRNPWTWQTWSAGLSWKIWSECWLCGPVPTGAQQEKLQSRAPHRRIQWKVVKICLTPTSPAPPQPSKSAGSHEKQNKAKTQKKPRFKWNKETLKTSNRKPWGLAAKYCKMGTEIGEMLRANTHCLQPWAGNTFP